MANYIRLSAIFLALSLLNCCTPNAPDILLHDKIFLKLTYYADSLKSKNAAYTVVNMDSLSGIKWERIYFFRGDSGYPTDEGISTVIGTEFKSGGIPNDATRLIFISKNEVSAVVDFTQDENVWMWGSDEPVTEGYNLYAKFLNRKGVKFIFYPNCDYRKSYNLKPLSAFDARADLGGEFYKKCY